MSKMFIIPQKLSKIENNYSETNIFIQTKVVPHHFDNYEFCSVVSTDVMFTNAEMATK